MTNLAHSGTPVRRPGTSDPDEFQMPLSGLYADLELGRGSVRLGDEFLACSSLARLELLRDWQRSLAAYREDAMKQFAAELTGGSPGLAASERAALVRSACETLHIEVPTDFDMVITES